MDHAERLSQNLEALGVENLSSLSLGELMDKVDKKLPSSSLSRRRLLHPFISWLHERLTIIDNSDEEIVRNEIRKWVDCLRTANIPDTVLAGNFKVWESEHVKLEPLSARRLSLAWIELKELLDLDGEGEHSAQEQGDQSSHKESGLEPLRTPEDHDSNHSHESKSHQEDVDMVEDYPGDMHPDRARQLGQDGDVVIDNERWGGMHPDRFKQSLQDGIVEKKQPVEKDLSFLTGANHLVYLEVMKDAPPSAIIKNQTVKNAEIRAARREVRREELKKAKEKSISDPRRQELSQDLTKHRKRGKWTCRRCGSEGHPMDTCWSELLPEYDITPSSETYICAYCGSKDHYSTNCRKNPLPESANQRRIEAGIWERLPSPGPSAKLTPRGSGRQGRAYERDSDEKFGTESYPDFDLDYGDDLAKSHRRNYERDYNHHSRDHSRDRDFHGREHKGNRRWERGHERYSAGRSDADSYQHDDHLDHGDEHGKSYFRGLERGDDRDDGRNGLERDWAGNTSDQRDERRPHQSSQNWEEPRANQGSSRYRSPSPKTWQHKKKGPHVDRYRSSRRASYINPSRSRSPASKDLRTAFRRLRSPIEDHLLPVSRSEERDLIPEVTAPDHIHNDQQADEAEGTSQGHEPRDQPLVHPSRTILFRPRKVSGILSYSDNLDTAENDVTMPTSEDDCTMSKDDVAMAESTTSARWYLSVAGLTPEEFTIALDEFIHEMANEALPRGDIAGQWSAALVRRPKPAEDLNSKGASQTSEDIQPVTPLTTTIEWSGMIITRQKQSGDMLSESLTELSIHEFPSVELEKSPPLTFGISVKPKPDNSESLYDAVILDLMKKADKENTWLHKARRSRARELLNAKEEVGDLTKTRDLTLVKVPATSEHETGLAVSFKQGLNGIVETIVSCEQDNIMMAEDGIVNNTEVNVPATAGDSSMAEDLGSRYLGFNIPAPTEDLRTTEMLTSEEPRVGLSAQNERHVMTNDIDQQQTASGQATTDDHQVMTDALLAPEQQVSQSMDEKTRYIRALEQLVEDDRPPNELSVSAEESSYISLDTEDGSITEPGDQLTNDVDMLDPDAAHD